ncbi:hypothetical protein M3Y94_00637000 [Aphelenchoides besseyi]|nr:hypothetical protein M3Y94_00637000 [Aphelenchoides besseyi]KAI6230985.1 hypothetical protein M3Y95_00333600 [Aphelenchoides besseyi]
MPSSVTESIMDDAIVIAGPKYKNVNHPTNCIITFIYSKSSIGFLCLIGCFTTISTYLFTTQIAKSNLLCMFNDYLPLDEELHQKSTPTRYYCRFLECSVPANIFQLLFCLAALFFALNRRSRLFFTCYVLLGLSILFATVFLACISFIDYERFIIPSVNEVLRRVVYKDQAFCSVLEPLLACRLGTKNQTDLIEHVCNAPRRHLYLANDCVEHLTGFLDNKGWIAILLVQYCFLLFVGLVIVIRSAIKIRIKRRRTKQPARVIVMDNNGRCSEDNQQSILAPTTEL